MAGLNALTVPYSSKFNLELSKSLVLQNQSLCFLSYVYQVVELLREAPQSAEIKELRRLLRAPHLKASPASGKKKFAHRAVCNGNGKETASCSQELAKEPEET